MRTINKRIISLILALIMLCGAMPISIFATMKTTASEENQWEGRSAIFVGDSITAGVGTEKIYYEYLDECLELSSVTPMGVSGSCISAFSDYGQSNQPLINRYENIPSADLIVVFMGTNDYGHETPLGSEQDTEDKSFYGALNVIIPALVEKHQSSKIVFVTSLHRYGRGTSGILGTNFTYDNIPNGVGATLGDYVNALKTICAKNGVSVIDLYTECTLDPTDATVRAEYMPDGLHPNAKGHEVIAEIIESHIRDYEPVEDEPLELPEMIQGNKFSATSNQPCRTSSRINYYLKAGTVITLKDPDVMQWACAKTSDEYSTNNLGYFPDSAWSDKESAVVAEDGWIGFTFKYRDETKSFDLTKPLSDFITIEAPDTHPNKAKYEGKVISILSASTSTFAGYIPEADGFNLAHRPRYPQDNLLTDVKETWWMQLINDLDAKLGINDSWAGSTVSNFIDGNSGDVGEDAAMASLTRIKNLGANGTPDVILFFGAGNDMGKGVELGSFDPATAPTEVDLTATKWDSFADAYVAAIMRLQHFYPDSKIVVMSTYAMPSYVTEAKLNKYGPVIRAICEHYGVPYVDLRDSGVTFDMLPDNIHPNAEGMDHITAHMLEFLLENCELTEGENVVHTITNNLTNARSSLGYYKGISHGKEFTTAISGENVEVKVTMGGSDVTAACYSNGVISIPSVTGDVVITASGKFDCDGHLQSLPHNVCSGTNLWTALERENIYYTASGWGNVSTGDSWSVTFPVKAGDKIFATAFGATPENGSNANGVRITWFNENGVLESLSRDKVYAEFVKNGYVTAPAGATAINLPHSSNNSEFEVYILNRRHTYQNGVCTGCGKKGLSMQYDDRYDVAGKTVEIVDAGTPTSYKVGYGVQAETPDESVVTLVGEKIIATGIGTATVKFDGVLHEITVEPAPISLILLIGQSNMRGSEGNPNQSIICPDGKVYSTYGDDRGADNTAMTENNATHYAASALAGEYCSINVEGTTDCLSGYPINMLTADGTGKIGPDSGFAYEWVKQTGEKIWVVNAAHGGTSITTWQENGVNYKEAVKLFSACQETLKNEIAAGHYTLSHMGYFWCQGCSDRGRTAEWYVEQYLAMHENLKENLTFDHDSDESTKEISFEFGGIIPVRVGSTATCYRDGVYQVSNPYNYHESFVDLRFSGPKVAQYWMANNPELEDIWLVCNIGEDWVWMPDGTNGVEEYFNAHYQNGTVDYDTQVKQSASWYKPTTPAAVHDSIHYNQIGYNEIGRESVRNALIMLGEIEAPKVDTDVRVLSWDGYTEVGEVVSMTNPSSATLVVPVVYPVWKSKDITYNVSAALTYKYYDITSTSAETKGKLTVNGVDNVSIDVIKGEPDTHYAAHLSQLPENVCKNVNIWNILEHDKYYFASGTNWSVYSGGNVCSVTIPVREGERIFASAFGKAGENGHSSSNGIRTTFFSDYGIAKTMSPAETYAEFSKNGGYIVAPEGATAINIAMWSDSDEWEIYLLDREHTYQNGTCTGCGKNISLKGKTVSILGASISTYAGTSNGPAADTTNSTIKNNVKYYPNNTIPEVGLQDTWWMQLVNDFDLRLLVNNSWSGSAIFLERSGTVGAYVDRCLQLHDNTGDNAGETPDIIIIQMGFNDFSYGKSTLGTANIDYDTLITENGYGTPSTTMEATAIMLDKITKRYPNAEIYMFNHFKRIGQSASDTSLMEELNASISTVCGKFGVNLVDLYTVLNAPELIGDGRLHPNRLGMDVITEAVKSSILSNTQYESDICKITFDLKDVNADYGTDKIVLEGDSFIVNLSASDILKVSVTMDGNDITSTVYNNGVISIDSVTGDVVITAQNVHEYKDYLFEFDGTDLVSVGETVNNLTKTEGTTANGVFTKTKYSLDKPIVLSHDKPWIVEWKCEGTFLNTGGGSGARIFTSTDVNAHYNARYIFKSNTNGFIAMGEKTTTGSHNYGIALGNHGIDWTALHTYKLENRIAEDGSNMIWLYVDGNEIGAMTDYYIGTNSQGTTSDWLSGKDFVFGYMGTDTHGFSNASINYIQVNECAHTYQNGACTACGEEEPTPGVNSVEELVEALREAMILREKNIVIRVNGLSLTGDDLHKAIIEAFEHTGDPHGGDYIKSHMVGGYNYNSEVLSDSDGVYSLVTVNCNFISTAEMEAEVDAAIDMLLKELDLWDASDYRKIKGVYDWICDNIEYDYDWDDEHPEENISYYQHTTHAAIIEKKAVCQGIASLFYRLMLELDVDCRYITGIADQPGDTDYHAWNIVKLDGKYYNMDATWDLGLTGHCRYFLCTETNFPWHIRDAEYNSDDFHTKYPMATLPYVENVTASGNLTSDISWVLDGDTGTLTVAGKGKIPSYGAPSYAPWYDYKDSIKTIIIGEGITEVGLRAFHWSINCTKVVLPESLIAVREYGFNNLRNLKSITLPSNLKIIEHCGFSECVALESIVLPDSVTTVDASAFANCYALKSATLSAGMKYVPSSMFFGDYRLTSVVLPEGITFIDDTAFADCGFKTFTIPSTLTKLGSSSFAGCKSLSKFIVEEGNTVYKSVDGVLFSADGTHLISYPAAKIGAYHIPEGTKYVDDSAFREQQYMTEVFFPSSLVEIGRYSFSYCRSLGKVTFPSTLLVLGNDAFRDCTNLYSVTFENQNVKLGDYLFSGCENLRNVTLPTGITKIPNGLFDDCVSLSSITIPSGVTSIGSTAFFNCDALKNVTIPGHVTYIGRQAFDYCQNLTTLTFEEGVKTIDRVAIRNAPRLNKVVIPASVTSIGVENFESCPNVVLYVKCGTAGYNYAVSKGIQYSSTHRYLPTVTYPPTCTEQGYTLYSCPCGKAASYRSDFTDRLPHDYVPTVTAPTCTEKGYTTHTCSMCGDSYVDSYVDMIEHSFGNWYEETAPTCTVDGLEKRECTRCDHYETRVLEKTGHSYMTVVTNPTCTEKGYTTHTCSKCGDTYVDSYVNELGHEFGAWTEVTAPTCTVDGLEKRECKICDHYETRVLEKTGHSYMTVVTNPTCTEKGYTTHTCPCGDSYVDNYVDALGHTWGNGVVTKEPTEQETGIRTYTCKICGEKREEIIPILTHTHNYTEIVTPPTCTAQGYTTHTCDCGYSYVDKYVDATGHNYTSVVTAPTCTERGYTTHTCSKCGDTYTDSYVNKLGHNLGSWYEVTAPTCTTDGLEKRECTRCDHYETNILEKTGHTYTSVVTAPTCTERGYTTHTCSKCGDTYTDSYVNKLGHNLGSWFEVTAPTCTVDGLEKRECTRCDHYETSVLEKTGHNYTSVITAPTCTERGYTTHTCSKCGDTYTDSYVNKLGHNLGNWFEVTAPTCTTDGLEKRECTRCDHYETNVLEKTGHTYTSVVTEPTCAERGYTTHTCHCGDFYVDSYVDKLDHTWDNGTVTVEPTVNSKGEKLYICVDCGEERREEIPELEEEPEKTGDVDGNDEVTSADAVHLLMYTFFPEDYPINQDADFDNSGTVDSNDAVYLLMYTFFPEDYPLIQPLCMAAEPPVRRREDEN